MTSRNGSEFVWYASGLPKYLRTTPGSGADSSDFQYTPSGRRWRHKYNVGTVNFVHTLIGQLFERVGSNNTDYKHYVYAEGRPVAVYIRSSTGTNATYYLLADHLGSTDSLTDAAGSLYVRESFDALGQRRGSAWTGAPSSTDLAKMNATTRRGYTAHEMLDSTRLIHMNGRTYDPALGRFLSADPLIDGALSTQGYNRYSYVANRPLSLIDPTGFNKKTLYANHVGSQWNFLSRTWGHSISCSGQCGGQVYGAASTERQAMGGRVNTVPLIDVFNSPTLTADHYLGSYNPATGIFSSSGLVRSGNTTASGMTNTGIFSSSGLVRSGNTTASGMTSGRSSGFSGTGAQGGGGGGGNGGGGAGGAGAPGADSADSAAPAQADPAAQGRCWNGEQGGWIDGASGFARQIGNDLMWLFGTLGSMGTLSPEQHAANATQFGSNNTSTGILGSDLAPAAQLVIPVGRLGYITDVARIPHAAGVTAPWAVAMRNQLRGDYRLGAFSGSGTTYEALTARGLTDAEIISSAGRTNAGVNLAAANVAASSASQGGCR